MPNPSRSCWTAVANAASQATPRLLGPSQEPLDLRIAFETAGTPPCGRRFLRARVIPVAEDVGFEFGENGKHVRRGPPAGGGSRLRL